MKLSPQWIRDYVDLAIKDGQLAEDLTNVGIAVEGISGSGADTVFEMEIGTNRPDAMNHYGVAREAAAIYDLPLKPITPRWPAAAKAATSGSAGAVFPITVEEPSLCPRFSARVIRNTRIKPSSEKIAQRLQLLDQRPISNAVDATSLTPICSKAAKLSCARRVGEKC
jgi:phenylalanyl-tRNA synthetase beta chain